MAPRIRSKGLLGANAAVGLSLLAAVGLNAWPVGSAQASYEASHAHHAGTAAAPAAADLTTDTPAAALRVTLNHLLSEHVYLAARATGAALGGREAEFQAAAAALDANSVDLSKALGSAYGPAAEAAFLPLWRSHIGMVVDYTVGLATDDAARQEKAVGDLIGYTEDFGAFLSGANENLPKEAVAGLVKDHVLTLKLVVDAQKAGNQPGVYAALREAYGHMGMIAEPLAGATAAKFADRIPGQASSPAAGLRVGLNGLLAEHVYLASSATAAALGGREAQFKAVAFELDNNSVDLSKAIGSAYGPAAEAAFLPLWRSHIGMVVDYTTGKATGDAAKQDKAINDLVGYTQDFGAFLSAANENLPKPVVADLVKMHALSLKDVIDAQAAKDETTAFTALRTAAGHMRMIADPLAEATVKKFPDRFAGLLDDRPVQAQLAQPVAAEMSLFAFQPAQLSVPVGTTVTWTNRDAIEHSVTAAGAFDSGLFGQGGSFAHTFDAAGNYNYTCARHPSMQGAVEVW